jgi:hypothetical protein
MTQARSTLIPPGHAVFVHVTTRCVRRAWLFGHDRFSNRRYDHRCGLIEARVRELAEVFAVGSFAGHARQSVIAGMPAKANTTERCAEGTARAGPLPPRAGRPTGCRARVQQRCSSNFCVVLASRELWFSAERFGKPIYRRCGAWVCWAWVFWMAVDGRV